VLTTAMALATVWLGVSLWASRRNERLGSAWFVVTDGIVALPREREVTTYVARGYSYRETANALSMSVKTLENHMHHIFTKLGLASRHELTRLAYETGFLRPDGSG
ncbi:MAG: LuxR C-terminal-related transcriptional regulator, partial [Acidimicrobiia bacterium]|nr:LuxR C-terminal-related transcriptional regulator [Acidimicrobiia bacterium]